MPKTTALAFPRPRSYAPAARPRLWFETLEPRRVLSVTLGNDGILTIRGTDNPDDFLIAIYSSPSADAGPNPLTDFVEVEQRSPEGNLAQAVVGIKGVRGIRLEAGAGNDLVSIEDRTDGHIPITLLGGAGDDTLAGTNAPDLLDGQAGNDSIAGTGGGNDTLPDAPWADPGRDPELVYDRYDRVAGRIHLDPDGTLRVTGTDADERIEIAFPEDQPTRLGVWINSVLKTLDPAPVRRIVVDAGAGNDTAFLYSWGQPISVPVTLIGGDGDDLLAGLWYMSGWPHDGQRFSPTEVGPLTVLGGNGNDTLYGGAGDSYLDAGPGQDEMEPRGGPTTFVDPPDPTPAPTPSPTPTPQPASQAPAPTELPEDTSASPTPSASVTPVSFASTTASAPTLFDTDQPLLGDVPQEVWS